MADLAIRVLSVGYDRRLMLSRSMVLRSHGYDVVQVYRVDEAIRLVESSAFDVVLLCHTLVPEDRRNVIAAAARRRPALPAVCLTVMSYPVRSDLCVVVEPEPLSLISGLHSAIHEQSRAPGEPGPL